MVWVMPLTHIRTEGDTLVIRRSQDCTAVLESCTARRNEGIHGSAELKHAATFPPVIVELYLTQKGISFNEFVTNPEHGRAMLNDPALSGFRIWQGRA